MEAVHNALDASIYRFSNDELHFKAEIVDPEKFWPNWSLCRDIVFIFVPHLFSWPTVSIATWFCVFFLHYVTT